jgi:hypothetical protein
LAAAPSGRRRRCRSELRTVRHPSKLVSHPGNWLCHTGNVCPPDHLPPLPREPHQLIRPRPVVRPRVGSTTSHFMTFSAVTELNSRPVARRYVVSSPSAAMSTAVPIRRSARSASARSGTGDTSSAEAVCTPVTPMTPVTSSVALSSPTTGMRNFFMCGPSNEKRVLRLVRTLSERGSSPAAPDTSASTHPYRSPAAAPPPSDRPSRTSAGAPRQPRSCGA